MFDVNIYIFRETFLSVSPTCTQKPIFRRFFLFFPICGLRNGEGFRLNISCTSLV